VVPLPRRHCLLLLPNTTLDSLASISAADYSTLPLQIPFEQLPQHGTISSGVQATPSGRQNWAPALVPKVDGVKKVPAAINNAPTSFNNEVFFIPFSPSKNKYANSRAPKLAIPNENIICA
jgi:hypothetical protein